MGLFGNVAAGAGGMMSPFLGGIIANSAGKTGGKDAGNAFNFIQGDSERALKDYLNYQGNQNLLDPEKSGAWATQQVQQSPLLAQLYGQGGTLSRTVADEQNLAGRGYSLQPEDYEAYGQASGNIARQFGGAEQGLAQALAARGLSTSGAATRGFMTSQGSKLEQLGQLQSQIAQQRMQMNMQRLGQTRNFLSQMAGQAGQEVNNAYNRGMGSEKERFGQVESRGQAAQRNLMAQQGQANENLAQRQATEDLPGWAKAMGGGSQMGFGAIQMVAGALGKNPEMVGQGAKQAGGAAGTAQQRPSSYTTGQ